MNVGVRSLLMRSSPENNAGVVLWSREHIEAGRVTQERQVSWGPSIARSGRALDGRAADMVMAQMRRGVGQLFLGFPSEAGVFEDEVLLWSRDRPGDPFTISESRAVMQELKTRGLEAVRRSGWSATEVSFAGSTIESVALDGKKVISPVGFTGELLYVHSLQTFLYPRAAEFLQALRARFTSRRTRQVMPGRLRRARRSLGHHRVRPLLIDAALAQVFANERPDMLVVLDETTTVLMRFGEDGILLRRVILAMGQESSRGQLTRGLGFALGLEAGRLLHASVTGGLSQGLKRRVRRALTPFLRFWVDVVEDAVIAADLPKRAKVMIASIAPFHEPFRYALRPQMLRRTFSRLGHVSLAAVVLGERLGLPQAYELRDARVLALVHAMTTSKANLV